MMGYEAWASFHNKHTHRDTWFFASTRDRTFKKHERKYSWTSKIDKAVWQGSTIGAQNNFDELPLAVLVKNSMDRPDIIDAGLTSFLQDWTLEMAKNQRKVADHVLPEHQMKYRAIIDIAGNTWSSIFTKLLCTNSVVFTVCAL